jgi:hypothetical protein
VLSATLPETLIYEGAEFAAKLIFVGAADIDGFIYTLSSQIPAGQPDDAIIYAQGLGVGVYHGMDPTDVVDTTAVPFQVQGTSYAAPQVVS